MGVDIGRSFDGENTEREAQQTQPVELTAEKHTGARHLFSRQTSAESFAGRSGFAAEKEENASAFGTGCGGREAFSAQILNTDDRR